MSAELKELQFWKSALMPSQLSRVAPSSEQSGFGAPAILLDDNCRLASPAICHTSREPEASWRRKTLLLRGPSSFWEGADDLWSTSECDTPCSLQVEKKLKDESMF